MAVAVGEEEGFRPGMVAMSQMFGDQLNPHPHVHALVTRGGWIGSGEWVGVPYVSSSAAEELFRHRCGTAPQDVLGRLSPLPTLSPTVAENQSSYLPRLAGFVKAFLASDAQARQLLNRSCLAFLISIIAAEDRPLINACLSSHAMLA
jgi:Putative transposase